MLQSLLDTTCHLVLEGIGLDLVWSRTYRSQSVTDGAMGRGWSHSFDVAAEFVAGGDSQLMTPLPRTVYGPEDWEDASLDDWLEGGATRPGNAGSGER